MIYSPLRYPGGKSKALTLIEKQLPDLSESLHYHEPFLGGGSVFLHLAQKAKNNCLTYWLNDINQDLYSFWLSAQYQPLELVDQVVKLKSGFNGRGKELYKTIKSWDLGQNDYLWKGVKFFTLNRITFSGLADSGGYSQAAFDKRFTDNSIERLRALVRFLPSLENVFISACDYKHILAYSGKDTFLFLDPPYCIESPTLYGKKGDLHKNFDHQEMSEKLKRTSAKFLLTYNDCPRIRQLYSWANIVPFQLQYGTNQRRHSAKKGNEIFIRNYEL